MIKSLFFGYTEIKNENVNFGMVLLRIFGGLALALGHGINKLPPSEGFIEGVADLGLPAAGFHAWMSAIAEFFGGLVLALGLATRPAALLIGINMGVAAFLQHGGEGFEAKEKALLFFFIALFFFVTGAGKYSIDKLINRR